MSKEKAKFFFLGIIGTILAVGIMLLLTKITFIHERLQCVPSYSSSLFVVLATLGGAFTGFGLTLGLLFDSKTGESGELGKRRSCIYVFVTSAVAGLFGGIAFVIFVPEFSPIIEKGIGWKILQWFAVFFVGVVAGLFGAMIGWLISGREFEGPWI